MTRPLTKSRLARALTPFALCAAAAVPCAQSASETTFVLAEGAAAAGGEAIGQTTGGILRGTVGQAFTGEVASSTNYTVHCGVSQQVPSFPGIQPLLTGTRPESADKDGGVALTAFGFNLTAPGAGATSILFDGVQRTVAVTGNTTGTVVTAQGVDTFGNPLVDVDLQLQNNHGAFVLRDSFQNEPALLAANPAQLAHLFKMRLHADPGQFYLLIFGESIPGFGLPVTPFDGQLRLFGIYFLFITPTLALVDANGFGVLEINMPSNPPLAGFPLEFQGVAIDPSLTSGAWTNVLTAVIQP